MEQNSGTFHFDKVMENRWMVRHQATASGHMQRIGEVFGGAGHYTAENMAGEYCGKGRSRSKAAKLLLVKPASK